jgi:hypothetical protein
MRLILQLLAAFYCFFKWVRCRSVTGGGYVFGSKVEVVNAFDSKILARGMGGCRGKSERETSERRAKDEGGASDRVVRGRAMDGEADCGLGGVRHRLGHGGLLSK